MKKGISAHFVREAKLMAWMLFGVPVLLAIALAFLGPFLLGYKRSACEGKGGIWAGETDYCQLPECVEAHTCRPSYHNTRVCEGLQAGLRVRSLIQHLGEPVATEGSVLVFEPSAGETTNPKAVAGVDGTVKQLDCRWPNNSLQPTGPKRAGG